MKNRSPTVLGKLSQRCFVVTLCFFEMGFPKIIPSQFLMGRSCELTFWKLSNQFREVVVTVLRILELSVIESKEIVHLIHFRIRNSEVHDLLASVNSRAEIGF